MIAVNELRIGNWVAIPECAIRSKILGICPEKYRIDNTDIDLDDCDVWFEPESIEPIPLTPEILEKCGFVCENANEDDRYYHLRLSNEKYCDLSFIIGDKNGFTEVCLFPYENVFRYQYLHQIQNIYFCLCGEELKINL